MATTIKIKRTNIAGKQPAVSDLAVGEFALNMADAKIFFRDPSNVIKEISGTSALNSLLDVNLSGIADGKILKWDAASSKWIMSDDSGLTYTTQIPTGTTKLRLDGSDSSSDDIEFVGSGATAVTRTDASKFTISSTDTTYPTLASIPDVTAGATNGQVLKWNSTTSKWSPSDNSVGTTINALNDIGDVNTSSPTDGQVLTWDTTSSKWVSSTISTDSLPTQSDPTTVGKFLQSDGTTASWEAMSSGVNEFDGGDAAQVYASTDIILDSLGA